MVTSKKSYSKKEAKTKKAPKKKTATKKRSVLVVSYSRTGFTKQLATTLAKDIKSDIEHLNFNESDRKGLISWLKCGKEATKKERPEILEPKFNPSKYKRIILATPIWAGKIASPLRTYIENYLTPKGKTQVDVLLTQAASGAKNAISDLKSDGLSVKNVLIVKTKDIKQESYHDRLKHFEKED